MPLGDTIVALGTPRGESAIAVVRLSGPECKRIAQEAIGANTLPHPRKAVLGTYRDKRATPLDHVLYTYFEGPASYTGEDMLEINCHGNPLIVQKVLEDLMARGCRHAGPGEFTRTAYLNQKMDLSQAEAVSDMITARSEFALKAAQKQLRGGLGKKVEYFTDELAQTIAELEAFVDFPEDDLPPEDEARNVIRLSKTINDLDTLIATSHYRSFLNEGVKTLIIGAPNAGKSSLLNALLGEERAIVSEQPGTTRDFISESIMIGQHCIRIIDTAGLHEAGSDIEKIGISKTMEKSHEADLFLLVIDQSLPYPTLPEEVTKEFTPEKTIVLKNKIDLATNQNQSEVISGCEHVSLSLKTGDGLSELRKALEQRLEQRTNGLDEDTLVVNARHAHALMRAKESVEAGLKLIKEKGPTELASSELREALEHLGDVVGKIDNEKILDKLFSTFCIGK